MSIFVVCCAASFGAHHAGTDGIFRRASRSKERAFRRDLHAAQNVPAGAELGLFCIGDRGMELYICIKGLELVPEFQSAPRYDAYPAPVSIFWLEIFVEKCYRTRIAFLADNARILDLDSSSFSAICRTIIRMP